MFSRISLVLVLSSNYVFFLAIFHQTISNVAAQQFCSYIQGNAAASALEDMVSANTNKPLTIEASPGESANKRRPPQMGINCDPTTESSCYALFTSSTQHTIEIISAGCLRKNASRTLGGAEQCQSPNCTASLYNIMGGGKSAGDTAHQSSSSSKNNNQAMTSSQTGGSGESAGNSIDESVKKLKYGFCCCSTQLCNQNVLLPKVTSPHSVKSSPTYQLLDTYHGGSNGRGNSGDEMTSTSYIVLSFFASLSLMGLLFLLLRYLHSHKLAFSSRARLNRARPNAATEHSLMMLETQQMGPPGGANVGDCCMVECSEHLHHSHCQQQHKTVDSSNVKLLKLIGNGRYGTVWHALMGPEQEVAVKLYRSEHKLYFDNEMHIYQTPLMNHPNIVNFFAGSWKLNEDTGLTEYMLVMAYIPSGSLLSYLRCTSAVDFSSMCKLAHSAAKGLAYLHSDVTSPPSSASGITMHKPAIVHRDFNSRNILVKSDGTCALSDLGFAQKVSGAKLYNGSSANLIPDVGTLRYMPPEVLEGSVDLNKCECALKQIDVYALALVLWEITSRCNELHTPCIPSSASNSAATSDTRSTSPAPASNTTAVTDRSVDQSQNTSNPSIVSSAAAATSTLPLFKLPFEAELGLHPKFDEMKNLVSCLQRRPQFPPHWNTENEVVRCLMDTIEESWDQDSEARLTAACVASRLSNLWTLWNAGNPSLGSSSLGSGGSGGGGGGGEGPHPNYSSCAGMTTAGLAEIEREQQQPLLAGMSSSTSSSDACTNTPSLSPPNVTTPNGPPPTRQLRLTPPHMSSAVADLDSRSPPSSSLIPYQSEHETPSPQLRGTNNSNSVHVLNNSAAAMPTTAIEGITRQQPLNGPTSHPLSSGPVLTPQCNAAAAVGSITISCPAPYPYTQTTPVTVTQPQPHQPLTSLAVPSLPSAANTEHDISPVFTFNNSSVAAVATNVNTYSSTPVVVAPNNTANVTTPFYRDTGHALPLVHGP